MLTQSEVHNKMVLSSIFRFSSFSSEADFVHAYFRFSCVFQPLNLLNPTCVSTAFPDDGDDDDGAPFFVFRFIFLLMKRALTKSSDKNVLEHELHFEFCDKYLMYIGIEHAHRFVYEKTSLEEHRAKSTVPGIKS